MMLPTGEYLNLLGKKLQTSQLYHVIIEMNNFSNLLTLFIDYKIHTNIILFSG